VWTLGIVLYELFFARALTAADAERYALYDA
jgi:hypothetical protein